MSMLQKASRRGAGEGRRKAANGGRPKGRPASRRSEDFTRFSIRLRSGKVNKETVLASGITSLYFVLGCFFIPYWSNFLYVFFTLFYTLRSSALFCLFLIFFLLSQLIFCVLYFVCFSFLCAIFSSLNLMFNFIQSDIEC